MSNKGERNRQTKIIFLRRLKKMGLLDKNGEPKKYQYCFKNQGKPCSCPICNRTKYKRKIKHKKKLYDQEENRTE